MTAVVLAAGQGRRMESKIQKQYTEVNGKPPIFYTLDAFEKGGVGEVVLVVGDGEYETYHREIVERFGFSKVTHIVGDGRERYHSVYEGLKTAFGTDYVLIHDGARPCVDERIVVDVMAGARKYGACVVGMPMKDTIKIADENEFAKETSDRRGSWIIQTPQAFSYEPTAGAYKRLLEDEKNQVEITDDAMVVESVTARKVKLTRGSYENMKVTAPGDVAIVEVLLRGC